MRKCVITFSATRRIKFNVDDEEEETAEEMVDLLEAGNPPIWLEEMVRKALEDIPIEDLYIEDWNITGLEPQPEEELDFGD